MTASINAILSNSEYELPLQRKEVDLNSEILKQYSGEYELGPGFNLKILVENDSLFVNMGENNIFHLIPQSENQFYMHESDAAIKFLKNENGVVDSAVLLNGFLIGKRIGKVGE